MDREKIAELEYEALQAEKRDKMNSRLQVWSLFFGLVGAAGLVSLQSSSLGSLVAIYPLLAMCLARYSGHSERVLDQVKARLLAIECACEYVGYEQKNREESHIRKSGGHIKALRDALLITEILATFLVVWQIWPHMAVLAVISAMVEALAMVATFVELKDHQCPTSREMPALTSLDALLAKKQELGQSRPVIVTHCGSTRRAMDAFEEWRLRDTLAGMIVLTIGANKHDEQLGITPEQAERLEILHLWKIELADFIRVFNVGGYIGESTRREIDYAERLGKPIVYLEQEVQG